MTDPVRTPDNRSPDYTPPLAQAIPLGLQHLLAMFAGNITVPIIIAGVIGADPAEKIFLIQAALLVAGVATLIQTIGIGPIGARLPIMQGTSFGFLPVSIPIAKTFGLSAVLGGALIGGLIQVGLGIVLRRIRHWFPPLITGMVVTIIGVSLMPVGIRYAGGGVGAGDFGAPVHLFLSTLVLAVIIYVNQYTKGLLGMAAILVGLVVGYVVAIPFGLINFATIADAAWWDVPAPLQIGLSFPLAAIIGMAFMALVTTIESIGDISGVTAGGAGREPTDRELSGGIIADGLGTSLAAVFNALPNTSYSQNVGVVAFTGVMSRHVVTIGALFLIAAGLFPKFGAVIAAMPYSVLGGAAIVMFGLIAAAGVKLMLHETLDRRAMLILGTCLTLGIGLPLVPEFAKTALPETVAVLMNTGLVPAALLALILNAVLPASPAENN